MKTKYIIINLCILFATFLVFSGCEKKLGEGVNLKDIQVGDSLILNIGETSRAEAWPVPWDCIDYEFSYESADTNIAIVDNYGRVTAIDVGNTVINISQGSIRKEIPVRVYEVSLQEKLSALSGLVGFWEFSDTSDIQKATIGKDLVAYLRDADGVLGTPSLAGITTVSGFNRRDHAIQIGHRSLLFCDHDIPASTGSSLVTEYTILWDINRPSGESGYATLLNTSVTNSNDQDYAIKNAGNIGVGTCGYTSNTISRDTWYRVVICLKSDEFLRIYVNGIKWLDGSSYDDDRFKLDPAGTLIMGDEDSDDHTMYLSSVAIYNRALSADEVNSLGGL